MENDSLLIKEKQTREDINTALDFQAMFWKEKACLNMFVYADRNTCLSRCGEKTLLW